MFWCVYGLLRVCLCLDLFVLFCLICWFSIIGVYCGFCFVFLFEVFVLALCLFSVCVRACEFGEILVLRFVDLRLVFDSVIFWF